MRGVAVVDFGSQYAHLIARRVRELGVYSELVPHDAENLLEKLEQSYAVILSGGPASVYEPNAPKLPENVLKKLIEMKKPLLGICYGHQLIAYMAGGVVARGGAGEYGIAELEVKVEDRLFEETPRRQKVWMSHKDKVVELPRGVILASTRYSEIAAYRLADAPVYGVQFHPEVRHTEYGMKILENFLFKVARCLQNWSMKDVAEQMVREIAEKYRGGNVLMAASGGVDSTTAAVIIARAVGYDKLHLVVVDTGLLRENEAERVVKILKKLGFKHVHLVDASKLFLQRLKGVTDPEQKRRIIADTFIEVFEEYAKELEKQFGKFTYLGQGTIYPDRIESGRVGRSSAKIKSHHNVSMSRKLNLELLEPLADLYKDEVRRVALHLGIPRELIARHPFPGPGLAVRILGEVDEEKLRILRKCDAILEEEIRQANIYEELWQAFPVLLPVKAVGVMGDHRTYGYVVAIRAVKSEDAMTAEFAKLDWSLLEKIAARIVNEVEEVTRVVYDITNKPPATIEFE